MKTLADLTAAHEATKVVYKAARARFESGVTQTNGSAERFALREARWRMEEALDNIRAHHHPFEGRVSLRELHLAEFSAESNRQYEEAYRALWAKWNDQGCEFDVSGRRVD